MSWPSSRRATAVLGAAIAMFAWLVLCGPGIAQDANATGEVSWSVHAVAEPSHFSSGDTRVCEEEGKCDRYQLEIANAGDVTSNGTLTLTDVLPAGLRTREPPSSGEDLSGRQWSCEGSQIVSCMFTGAIPAGGYAPWLAIVVVAPAASAKGALDNRVAVSGGGAEQEATDDVTTPISTSIPAFEVENFGIATTTPSGNRDERAGGHPWELTTIFTTPSIASPGGGQVRSLFAPIKNMKSASVELPPGVVGNPQALPKCTSAELADKACPLASRIGTFAIVGDQSESGEFRFTDYRDECCSAIYNMAPERGYPAEFAFTFARQTVVLYATLVRRADGYRVRVTLPGVPAVLETATTVVSFFGRPNRINELRAARRS